MGSAVQEVKNAGLLLDLTSPNSTLLKSLSLRLVRFAHG